jgi:hypothetical protein
LIVKLTLLGLEFLFFSSIVDVDPLNGVHVEIHIIFSDICELGNKKFTCVFGSGWWRSMIKIQI